MSAHIYDNRTPEQRVQTWLEQHLAPSAHVSIASAYFTVNAYDLLRHQLDAIQELRFLLGDPEFLKRLDPQRAEAAFNIADGGLRLSEQIRQNGVARDCARWIRDKVQIRSIRDGRLLHGKLYHINYSGAAAGLPGLFAARDAALMGSSNFTVYGLGGANGGNLELNMVAADDRDRAELRAWFDKLWDSDLVADVRDEILDYLNQLARDNSPQWLYYVTLYHLFRDRLLRRDAADLPGLQSWRETQIYQALYEFQEHGARGAIHKLMTYGGCVLADSVGLGKTYTALAVIKYFELRRERVLVLCPKKVRDNWVLYPAANGHRLNPFPKDNFGYALLAHTDLSRERGQAGAIDLANFDWGQFSLVVIDESHNFRNNTPGRRDENGEIIRYSRYGRLMEKVLREGVKTRVLMLSATPVNTDLRDLRNQIYLMTEGQDEAFEPALNIPSLNGLLTVAQREFNAWADPKQESGRDPRDLIAKLPSGFFTLLDELSIARSREHIRRFYQRDVATIGKFPDRLRPIPFSPDIDTQERFPTYDQLHEDIAEYQLSLFKPSKYLKPEFRHLYEKERVRNFSQEAREKYLIGMMRVNFLKRLESSVESFEISMANTIQKIDDLIQRIGDFQAFIKANPQAALGGLWQLSPNEIEDEELRDAFQISAVDYFLAHLRIDDWLKDLKADRRQLHRLYLDAKDVTPDRDAKLQCLKTFIAGRAAAPVTDKLGRPNRKVLVFTAFADTARYLYQELHGWAQQDLNLECGLVTGAGGNAATLGDTEFNALLTNFSPHSKRRAELKDFPQDQEIDLLIATDCISEGQNLQDCGVVVNYDIHWNPVRLIQRFGRVDRLGSLHDAIQMVNFWPTDDLNRYINLKHRVEARMALVDLAGTNQDNILSGHGVDEAEKQAREIIESDLSFRDRQLLRLRDETPDIEELDGGVSLSEFTLDDFIADLIAFLETRRSELEKAPPGLFTVVPPGNVPGATPGIVWCLRQRGPENGPTPRRSEQRGAVSRFAPYYVVYVRDDGSIALTYSDDKRMLSLLRGLCLGQREPWEQLCRAFDARTHQGEDMSEPLRLLQAATVHIAEQLRGRSARDLARGGKLDPTALNIKGLRDGEDTLDGWDLMTWFVIMPPA